MKAVCGPLAQQREAAATYDPTRAGRCMTATAEVSRFDPERACRLPPCWCVTAKEQKDAQLRGK